MRRSTGRSNGASRVDLVAVDADPSSGEPGATSVPAIQCLSVSKHAQTQKLEPVADTARVWCHCVPLSTWCPSKTLAIGLGLIRCTTALPPLALRCARLCVWRNWASTSTCLGVVILLPWAPGVAMHSVAALAHEPGVPSHGPRCCYA